MQVVIGEGTQIQPYAVVTPLTELQDGQELTPHAKASTTPSLTSAKGLAAALSNVIPGAELSPHNHTIAQVCSLSPSCTSLESHACALFLEQCSMNELMCVEAVVVRVVTATARQVLADQVLGTVLLWNLSDSSAEASHLMQIGALTLPLLIASVAAFVGCITFQKAVTSLGLSFELPVLAYTTAAIVAMSNPVLAIFGIMVLPVSVLALQLAWQQT